MARPLAKDLFFSMAPYFFDLGGHYFSYHAGLQEVMEKQGLKAFTYIPRGCAVKGLDDKWVPFFRSSQNKIIRMLCRFIDYAKLISKLAKGKGEKKILFLESYSLLDLIALIPAILLFSRNIQLWHLFRDGLEWCRWKQALHVLFSKCCRFRLGKRYKAFADSERIVDSLSPLIHCPISLLPVFHTFQKEEGRSGQQKEKFILWVPGKFRHDKGTREILQFARQQDKTLDKFELWLAENSLFPPQSTNLALRFLNPFLTREEYEDLFSQVDALILPYDPILYVSRTSGPFVEAICAGKIVFTRDGNWLAYELRKHALTECILNWEEDDLSTKMLTALEDPLTHSKLKAMQEKYRSFHNMQTLHTELGKHVV